MQKMSLTLTARQYDADLGYLRKQIVLDRSSKLSEVVVSDGFDSTVSLFIDHRSLYIVGIDFGQGRYHLPDEDLPDLPNSKDFEFGGNYNNLGMKKGIELNFGTLTGAVSTLAMHRVSNKGSEFMANQKEHLIRLIFAVSEALRFWDIQRDVSEILRDYSKSLDIFDYTGTGKKLNNWKNWSKPDTPFDKLAFVPAILD